MTRILSGDPEPERPFIRRVVSHGNANGMGLADFITDRLLDKVDLKTTYLNVLTSLFVQRCFIPLHFPSEKETIEMALASLGASDPRAIRLMIIPNTLHLDRLYVSEALVPEMRDQASIEIVRSLNLEFDAGLKMANRIGLQVL